MASVGRRSNDDIINSGRQMALEATDLTDEEVKLTVQIINDARLKYAGRSNSAQNLEFMRDEVLTRMAEVSVLAEFDPSPCLYGEPPIVEIRGKVANDSIHQYGFDHERKQKQVIEANKRNEHYRGQRER